MSNKQTIRALAAMALAATLGGCAFFGYGKSPFPVVPTQAASPVQQAVGFQGVWTVTKRDRDGAVLYKRTYHNLVVNAGLGAVVDGFQGNFDISTFTYLAFGSGSGTVLTTDTGPRTEFTTEYATNSVRVTCTQGESAFDEYTCQGTFTPDAAVTVEEMWLMSDPDVAQGTAFSGLLGTHDLDGAGENIDVTVTITASAQ